MVSLALLYVTKIEVRYVWSRTNKKNPHTFITKKNIFSRPFSLKKKQTKNIEDIIFNRKMEFFHQCRLLFFLFCFANFDKQGTARGRRKKNHKNEKRKKGKRKRSQ